MAKTLLFEAGPQLGMVRAVMLFSLACAAASVYAGENLTRTYGSSRGDGGKLQPFPVRLAWGLGVGSLGVVFAAGMWVYGRCYVSRVELDEGAKSVTVHTAGFLRGARQQISLADVTGTRRHQGRADFADAPSVNAPWRSIRVRGRALPFILDEQGVFHDRKRVDRLFPASG